jgi:hypothetical protein
MWTDGHDRTISFRLFSSLVGSWSTYDVFMVKFMNAHLVEDGGWSKGAGSMGVGTVQSSIVCERDESVRSSKEYRYWCFRGERNHITPPL